MALLFHGSRSQHNKFNKEHIGSSLYGEGVFDKEFPGFYFTPVLKGAAHHCRSVLHCSDKNPTYIYVCEIEDKYLLQDYEGWLMDAKYINVHLVPQEYTHLIKIIEVIPYSSISEYTNGKAKYHKLASNKQLIPSTNVYSCLRESSDIPYFYSYIESVDKNLRSQFNKLSHVTSIDSAISILNTRKMIGFDLPKNPAVFGLKNLVRADLSRQKGVCLFFTWKGDQKTVPYGFMGQESTWDDNHPRCNTIYHITPIRIDLPIHQSNVYKTDGNILIFNKLKFIENNGWQKSKPKYLIFKKLPLILLFLLDHQYYQNITKRKLAITLTKNFRNQTINIT